MSFLSQQNKNEIFDNLVIDFALIGVVYVFSTRAVRRWRCCRLLLWNHLSLAFTRETGYDWDLSLLGVLRFLCNLFIWTLVLVCYSIWFWLCSFWVWLEFGSALWQLNMKKEKRGRRSPADRFLGIGAFGADIWWVVVTRLRQHVSRMLLTNMD